jgi:phosphoglycolate phosphatase-like HAD superfamily hydrolase
VAHDVVEGRDDEWLARGGRAGGGGRAVMVGDSVWDCVAAARVDVPVIGVLTGGFGEEELRVAGAVEVVASLTDVPAFERTA